MKIWTIQPIQIWDLLRDQKVLYVDRGLCQECDLFPEAFSWMCQQMGKRVLNYQGHLPWWGWQHPKPDLRFYSRKGINGTQHIRIELEIPEDRVLLSLEHAWIALLNHIFVCYTDVEGVEWDVALEQNGIDDRHRPLPEPWQSQLVASWERIFDLPGLFAGEAWPDTVQATFEELRLSDVIQVTPFTIKSSMGV